MIISALLSLTEDLFLSAFNILLTLLIGALAWFLKSLYNQVQNHAKEIHSLNLRHSLLAQHCREIHGHLGKEPNF